MVYVAELNTNNKIKLSLSSPVSSFSPECLLLPHISPSLYHKPLDGSLACLFNYYKALKRIQTIKWKTSWSHRNIKAPFSLDQLCQGRCIHFTLRAVISAPFVTDHRKKPWLVLLLQTASQFVSLHFARMDIFTETVKRNVYCLQAPFRDTFSNT